MTKKCIRWQCELATQAIDYIDIFLIIANWEACSAGQGRAEINIGLLISQQV
jgi:hypothetical protein